MNNIRSLDKDSGALVCDAGCILEQLDNHVNEFGLTMPIDLGAKGSCHIGGNISTNAGGIRFVRYGSLHGSVLGLEIVLPNGTIINNLSTLRKDSTGYDIKQLFIGAEGTLGIVTGVSILTAKKPSKLQKFLEESFSLEIVSNGVLAQDITQQNKLWMIRESIIESISKGNKVYKYDLSLPVSNLYDIVNDVNDRLEELLPGLTNKNGEIINQKEPTDVGYVKSVNGFGHIGDGNVHLNVVVSKYNQEIEELLEPYIFEWVQSLNGSISAEHGVGIVKPTVLKYSKEPEVLKLMKMIKDKLDPNAIMNPYKVLM
ncbi:D-2-hydroxyglutarate dehydrogenase, mitochondrial [Smittium culicis]|uniref:D-2-hydroxyglutarate dehydrogenase, mitochondrial n=1 Tax=Smittium culicis TaxID=133412 RepID=A0A1R1Y7F7_9FUNG|nr:D-2-hydroxyglutarate dehydrogenase, mitochondrial [Smittium culicis]